MQTEGLVWWWHQVKGRRVTYSKTILTWKLFFGFDKVWIYPCPLFIFVILEFLLDEEELLLALTCFMPTVPGLQQELAGPTIWISERRRNPLVTPAVLHRSRRELGTTSRRTAIAAALLRSEPDRSLSLEKDTWKHLKDSQTMMKKKQALLASILPIVSGRS